MSDQGFRRLRDATASELDKLFRKATSEAAQETIAAGLPVCGTDEKGMLIRLYPDGTREIVRPSKPPR